MIGIIVGLIILSAIAVTIYRTSDCGNRFCNVVFGELMASMVLIPVVLFCIVPLTGGLAKNYGEINQIGYLTNLSEAGLIWKTHEGELQKGVGEQATAETAFRFSATNKNVIDKLRPYLGSKTRLHIISNQWLIMPFWRGNSDNEVIVVLEIN